MLHILHVLNVSQGYRTARYLIKRQHPPPPSDPLDPLAPPLEPLDAKIEAIINSLSGRKGGARKDTDKDTDTDKNKDTFKDTRMAVVCLDWLMANGECFDRVWRSIFR